MIMEEQVPLFINCHKQFRIYKWMFYAYRKHNNTFQAIYDLHSYYYYNDGEYSFHQSERP